jgi:probable HAF family extracellular repeat protein
MGEPNTYLTGASADAGIVVGVFGHFGPVWRWTAATGVVTIGGTGFQAKISRDGKTIVSNAEDTSGIASAAIWQGGTSWKMLGGVPGGQEIDGQLTTAYSVSGDGSIIVGLAWVAGSRAHAFRWDAQNGMIDLGTLQGTDSRANVVSADGNVILGWDANPQNLPMYLHDYWRGAMWWQGLERLLHPFGWISQVYDTNFNGTVWVGYGHPAAPRHAYRMASWGSIDDLGALVRGLTPQRREEEDQSIATAVSDDGNVVAGESGYKPPRDAFIWTPQTKMVKLSDYAASLGIQGMQGWLLLGVSFVSPDGKILAGVGRNPRRLIEGYVLKLP